MGWVTSKPLGTKTFASQYFPVYNKLLSNPVTCTGIASIKRASATKAQNTFFFPFIFGIGCVLFCERPPGFSVMCTRRMKLCFSRKSSNFCLFPWRSPGCCLKTHVFNQVHPPAVRQMCHTKKTIYHWFPAKGVGGTGGGEEIILLVARGKLIFHLRQTFVLIDRQLYLKKKIMCKSSLRPHTFLKHWMRCIQCSFSLYKKRNATDIHATVHLALLDEW